MAEQPESLPLACDMSSAPDTPEGRLAEYDRLFATALSRRQRTATGVVFTFRQGPGVLEWVEDLSRREAACCPFLDYQVESRGTLVVWTIRADQPPAQVILDEFHRLPDHGGHGYESLLSLLGAAGLETEATGPVTTARMA